MATKKQPHITHTGKTFNEWISINAARLKERVSLYSKIDEDAFQDAYLFIVSAPEHGSTSDYEADFLKAYRRISNKNIGDDFSLCHPDELFFSLLPAEDSDMDDPADEAEKIQNASHRIRRHIQATYTKSDVKVFDMKADGCSCRDISALFGIGTVAINNIIKRIVSETRLWLSKNPSKMKGYETL